MKRPLFAAQSSAIDEIAVVVPARDEEALIGRCLDSLAAARAHLAATHPDVAVRILVVADSCLDSTEAVVRAHPSAGAELLSVGLASVGASRAVGVRRITADLPARRLSRVWLASTDADSVVPEVWLSHQVELATQGADVVVGTVRPDPRDLTLDQDAAWRAAHTPGQPNGHVHGANLGVRASAYVEVGGFDEVVEHEDNLLVARLRDTGAAIVASDGGEVLTSGRRVGRTPGGYAAYLEQSLGAGPRHPHDQHDQHDQHGLRGLEPEAAQ